MECYSEQIVSIFVDGELPVEEAQRLRDHLATCRRCRQLLDALPGGARGGALRRAARVGVGLGATGRATSPRLASGMGDGRGAGARFDRCPLDQ